MSKEYKYQKWLTIDGRRYVVRADTLEELYQKLAAKKQAISDGIATTSGSMSVSQWTEQCLTTYKVKASERTLADTRRRLKKWMLPVIGAKQLKKVKPIDCQTVINRQAGMSDSLIRKTMQEMRFVFRTARQNGLIVSDPTELLVKPASVKGVRRSLTDDERAHFLAVAKANPRFLLFELMLYCGCRPAEAMRCQGKDIIEIDGRHLLHIRGTKTANADRFVPVPSQLYDLIKKTSSEAYIAPNTAGKMHGKESYRKLCKTLKRELNLSMGAKTYRNALLPPLPLAADFVPYMLRHTYCTDLQKAGIDVRTAQKLMGHANISITADIYTHVDRSEVLKAADLLEQNRNTIRNTISDKPQK